MIQKHGSLFTGCDVFGEAAKTNGFDNVFGCEIDTVCRFMFQEKNPDALLLGDIRFVNCDLLTFGFPCQDVSNALTIKNNNPLYDGTKTVLFWEAIRLLQSANDKPSFIVAENVDTIRSKGLNIICEAFTSCGYIPTWCVLPASIFGALHRRKRVFIIGHSMRFGWDTGKRIFDKVLIESKERKFLERQLYGLFYQEFQKEADSQRYGDFDESTSRLFDGLLVKIVGNAIYYSIAEIITRLIKIELTTK
jgi:site-specific DNA-cytosine methylase